MSYNTLRAPSLSSYEGAVKWYEATKPIRGHKDKVRPLGERRYHHRGSISMTDAGVVQLHLWGKPFVEWHKDNTFVVTPPLYVSSYGVADMSGFLPHNMRFVWDKCRLFLKMVDQETLNEVAYQVTDEVLRFSVIGERKYKLHNKPAAIVYRRRRNAIPKFITERYGAFLSWMTVVIAVDNRVSDEAATKANTLMREACGIPSQKVYQHINTHHQQWYSDNDTWEDVRIAQALPMAKPHARHKWFHTESCKLVDSWLAGDDPDMWVQALHVMGCRYGQYTWGQGTNSTYRLFPSDAERFLVDLASHLYLDKLYSKEVLEDGAIPSRNYLHYTLTAEIKDIPNEFRIVPNTL